MFFTKTKVAMLAALVCSLMQTQSVLAQSAEVIEGTLYLPQTGGFDTSTEVFTNTINLNTDDTNLAIGSFGSNEYTQDQTLSFADIIDSAGTSNELSANIYGIGNALYFTQLGNSYLSLNIDGDRNMITLAELGGSSLRRDDVALSVLGSNNEVDSSGRKSGAIIDELNFGIEGDYIVVELNYDDFANIVGDIGNNAVSRNVTLTINQDNDGLFASDTPLQQNAVQFTIDGDNAGALASIFAITQTGVANQLVLTTSGDSQNVTINQTNDTGALNYVEVVAGAESLLDISVSGETDTRITLEGSGNAVVSDNSAVRTVVENSDLLINVLENDTSGASSDNNKIKVADYSKITITITGDGNRVGGDTEDESSIASNGSFEVIIKGDSNQLDISNDRYTGAANSEIYTEIYGSNNQATINEEGVYGDYSEYYLYGDGSKLYANILNLSSADSYILGEIASDYSTAVISIDLSGSEENFPVFEMSSEGPTNNNYIGVYNSGDLASPISYSDAIDLTPTPFLYKAGGYSSALDLDSLSIKINGNGNQALLTNKAGNIYEGVLSARIDGDNNRFQYSVAGINDLFHEVTGPASANGWEGYISNGSGTGFYQNITGVGSAGWSFLASAAGSARVESP